MSVEATNIIFSLIARVHKLSVVMSKSSDLLIFVTHIFASTPSGEV